MSNDGYATGDLWETKDGKRVIVIQSESLRFRGERMFCVLDYGVDRL